MTGHNLNREDAEASPLRLSLDGSSEGPKVKPVIVASASVLWEEPPASFQ